MTNTWSLTELPPRITCGDRRDGGGAGRKGRVSWKRDLRTGSPGCRIKGRNTGINDPCVRMEFSEDAGSVGSRALDREWIGVFSRVREDSRCMETVPDCTGWPPVQLGRVREGVTLSTQRSPQEAACWEVDLRPHLVGEGEGLSSPFFFVGCGLHAEGPTLAEISRQCLCTLVWCVR